jgi:hypothetical protein
VIEHQGELPKVLQAEMVDEAKPAEVKPAPAAKAHAPSKPASKASG